MYIITMDDITKSIDLIQRINNYPGLARLTKLVQNANPAITKQEIKTYLDNDNTRQLFTPQKKSKPTGHITAFQPNELWQMDIFDLSRYSVSNDGYKYVLACVDVFTRKAFIAPLKEKSSVDVEKGFEHIIKHGGKPRLILSDQDSTFLSNPFQAYMRSKDIILNANALGDHHALGIIDNFAKRLKLILNHTFVKYNNTKWINEIDRIVSTYNGTPHSSIDDVAPNNASKPENAEKILGLNIQKNLKNKTISDLTIGDKVRKDVLFNNKNAKGTDPRWSDAVFSVKGINGQTITLNDNTKYKRTNLLKVPNDSQTLATNPITVAKKVQKAIRQEIRNI